MDNKALMRLSGQMCRDYQIKTPDATYLLSTLSGGNMQKVVFAREMEADPTLLVAAQPTRGIDIGAIESIWTRIIQARDEGKAVLLVSAELDEVLSLADRVLVMYEGQLVGQLNPKTTTVAELGLYMSGAKRNTKGGAQA